MRRNKRLTGLRRAALLFALVTVGFQISPAHAHKLQPPDPANVPALSLLIKQGTHFIYIGHYDNLDGWMAVKDSRVQIIYSSADGKYALAGYLFGADGENITSQQVKKIAPGNKEIEALSGTDKGAAATTAADTTVVPSKETPEDIALPPGERLIKLLQHSPGVALGGKPNAPTLYALITPGMPACKSFWMSVRDAAKAGTVTVRLYPAGISETEEERKAAMLLQVADPMTAWDKFAAGDEMQLAGAPKDSSLAAVRLNTALVTKWHLPTAPYIVYRSKDGIVKVLAGAPADIQAVIADLAPPVPPTSSELQPVPASALTLPSPISTGSTSAPIPAPPGKP